MATNSDVMEKIVSLSKRRGFVFQSSEIYGGLNGCWDYGPLGVELLRNVKEQWWQAMTFREDVEGLDASILMHPTVWEASGHVANFTDPMVDCKECKARFRADQVEDAMCGSNAYKGRKAHKCQSEGKFTEARQFNLMFKTFVGPVEDAGAVVYLRPETAQGIFVNFLNVQTCLAPEGAVRHRTDREGVPERDQHQELPLPDARVRADGDAVLRETGDRCGVVQLLEGTAHAWFLALGMTKDKIRFHQHEPDKLAHYAKDAYDIEYLFPFGWGEIEGIHNRTDFDLSRHEQFSGKSMKYFEEQGKEKFTPFIIETSAGASRSFMAFLVNAYTEEEAPTADGKTEMRVVMKFHPKLAPTKAAIFPLVNRDGMPEIAKKIEADLRPHFRVFYDDSGAVGRRYRRQDEVGTPFCITVDSQTLTDQTVTVRERDSMQQERVASSALPGYLKERL